MINQMWLVVPEHPAVANGSEQNNQDDPTKEVDESLLLLPNDSSNVVRHAKNLLRKRGELPSRKKQWNYPSV
jgi:hypothetical protein